MVVFTPEAMADIVNAVDWYQRQAPGLGQRLTLEIDRVIGSISSDPILYPIVRKSVRRAMLKRFPYALFYRVMDGQIQVIACFHTSRNPRRWHLRT